MNIQRIKRQLLTYFVAILTLASVTQHANAASATIAGQGGNEMSLQVTGTYVYNSTISFDEPGAYRVTLTDFKGPSTFDALGVMINTAKQKMVDEFSYGTEGVLSKVFTVSGAGEYYFSLFAVTDRQWNLGKFGLSIEAVDPANVPLPPALVLMMSGVMTLVSFVRRRQAA